MAKINKWQPLSEIVHCKKEGVIEIQFDDGDVMKGTFIGIIRTTEETGENINVVRLRISSRRVVDIPYDPSKINGFKIIDV